MQLPAVLVKDRFRLLESALSETGHCDSFRPNIRLWRPSARQSGRERSGERPAHEKHFANAPLLDTCLQKDVQFPVQCLLFLSRNPPQLIHGMSDLHERVLTDPERFPSDW